MPDLVLTSHGVEKAIHKIEQRLSAAVFSDAFRLAMAAEIARLRADLAAAPSVAAGCGPQLDRLAIAVIEGRFRK